MIEIRYIKDNLTTKLDIEDIPINRKAKWIDLISRHDSEYEEFIFDYSPFKGNEEYPTLPYDDFYGEVNFNVQSSDLTLEQLLNFFGDETVEIRRLDTGRGSAGPGPAIAVELIGAMISFFAIEVIKNRSTYYNEYQAKKFTTNEIISKLKRERVTIFQLIDYFDSKTKLTKELLSQIFPLYTIDEIDNVMTLLMYRFNNVEKSYEKINHNFGLSDLMDNLDYETQMAILNEYVLYKVNNISIEEINLEYLSKFLNNKVPVEFLSLIIKDLDASYKHVIISKY